MRATLNIVSNPFHPTLDRVQKPIQRKVRINTLVQRHKIDLSKPVICYYNGDPILRAQWGKTTVKDNDVVTFVYLVQGGGGSNPLRLLMMMVIAYYAPMLATQLNGALGLGLAAEGLGMSLLTSGIGMLGNMLVNALIPPPQPPKAQQANAGSQPSPTYSIGAQGNQARIGQALPVLYGSMKVYPDFAAQPYAEYADNEQYLYQLFCVTQGKAQINAADVFVEDSQLSSFGGDFALELVQPNTTSTLFPRNVYNVSEISGQEMLTTSPLGPFSANPTLTTVSSLAFDIIAPKGLFHLQTNGDMSEMTAYFETYARLIDDAGTPIAAEFLLGTETVAGSSGTAIRKTFKYAVAAGRYQIRVMRTDSKSTSNRDAHDIIWAGARGYAFATDNYGDVTMLAVKIKATNNISSQSSRKINVIANRLLPIPTWNAGTSSFDWSVPTGTQSIAWAIADMCRAAYGAGVTDARFDVGQLAALDAIWTARGDKLNCLFDSTQTFWDALTMACRAGRARPYIQGGMIHFVRDAAQTMPTALFTDRNIVKGSFKITYMMHSDDTADAVDVEYFDEVIWKPRIVRAQLDDVITVSNPAKIKAFGVTNRNQAFREGMYSVASNRYRRKEISFETELEGHIPSLGDLIAIQSDIPKWGQHGEVVSATNNAGTWTLVVNEPLTWTPAATHYLMLRRLNGSAQGPIIVTQGATPSTLVLQTAPDFTTSVGVDKEKTHITFGPSGQVTQLARVLTTTPRIDTVQITAINEDARVHSADGSVIPTDLYNWSLITPSSKPILADFNLTQTGSGATPSLALSWLAASGASRYIIQRSTDNVNWETLGEITGTSFSIIANIGLVYVRVAAFGSVVGPYVTKSFNVGAVPPPLAVASGSVAINGHSFDIQWAAVEDCDGYYVEVYAASTLRRSFNTTKTNFAYTVENAIADGGPWRTIEVRVKAKKGSVYSTTALSISGTNSAPLTPTVTLDTGVKNVNISISPCSENDYVGTMIWASTSPGFTPNDGNKIFDGVGNFFQHVGIDTIYIRAAHYDTYGKTGLNLSVEQSATPETGFGVYIEYSVDGATAWHSTYTNGDLYMRQKVDSGGTWSAAIRIVGSDAYAYWMTVSAAALAKSQAGAFTPTTLSVSGTYQVGDAQPAAYAGRFKIYENGSGTASYTSIADEASKVYTPSSSSVTSIKVEMYKAGGTTNKLDEQTIPVVTDGVIGVDGLGAITIATSNDSVTLAADSAGTVSSYVNSGTTIEVWEGATKLTYVTSAPVAGQFSIATATLAPAASITVGAYSGSTTTTATVAAHSAMTQDQLIITYPLTIKRANGSTVAMNAAQSVTKARAGATGPAGTGTAGDSYRIAYSKTTLASLSSTPATITTSGNSTFPANASWGAGTVWGGSPLTLVAGESLYQSDGVYNPTLNQTVWSFPYLSSLKVGSLSAISANMGAITAGTITLDTAGHIKGGQTAYNTGTGFFLGYSTAAYKFSIGNGSAGLTWDGAALNINGNLNAGSITLGTGFAVTGSGVITLKSATSGARLEIVGDVIRVYDAAGTLRVKIGNLA